MGFRTSGYRRQEAERQMAVITTQMEQEVIGRVQRAVRALLEVGCTAEEVLQLLLQ